MRDFKNNIETTRNFDNYVTRRDSIDISLVICVWNTSHLLGRSLEMYCKQDLPKEKWELIIIDDCSEDDCFEVVKTAWGKINLRYIRLEHNYGMRGNTCAFNTGFAWAYGSILAESTPETMFPVDLMRRLYEPHTKHDNIFVAAKTFNLTREVQAVIDSVDWRDDLSNIMRIPGFFNDWTLNNFKNTHFGTHQTCSIKKELFYKLFPQGFPLYGDYGSEDPAYLNRRERNNVRDLTIMQPLAFHQWHAPWQYWAAKGKAPNTNRHGHSLSNYMNDDSGEVPTGGTRFIWDGGSEERLSDAEIAEWWKMDDAVRATGCKLV